MSPPNPLKAVKKKMEEADASMHGKKWVSDVQSENNRWKPLDEWTLQFEPPKPKREESERTKKMKANMITKAKNAILSKVHETMSEKLTKVVLEVTSKILSKIEDESSDRTSDTKLKMLPELLNTCNGIVLTFRFGQNKKTTRKFVYMRKVACDGLTHIIQTESRNLSAMQSQLRSVLCAPDRKEETKQLVSEKFDMLVMNANEQLDQRVETSMARMDQRHKDLEDQADDLLRAAGIQRPSSLGNIVSETKEQISAKAQEMKEKKDAVLMNMTGIMRDLLLNKLEPLADAIQHAIDTIFVAFTLAAHKFNKEEEKLREEIQSVVEEIFEHLQQSISDEVEKVTDFISAMMQRRIDGTDEEEEEEEEHS